MHDENRFHALADATLMHFYDQLEDAFERGDFEELELEGGILTIQTASGQTFILNKHAPSMQIWLASPLSGGHHFPYDETATTWVLPDGTLLKSILERELMQAANVKVIL